MFMDIVSICNMYIFFVYNHFIFQTLFLELHHFLNDPASLTLILRLPDLLVIYPSQSVSFSGVLEMGTKPILPLSELLRL